MGDLVKVGNSSFHLSDILYIIVLACNVSYVPMYL